MNCTFPSVSSPWPKLCCCGLSSWNSLSNVNRASAFPTTPVTLAPIPMTPPIDTLYITIN